MPQLSKFFRATVHHAIPRSKKGLSIYIDYNALNEHNGHFFKKCCTNNLFCLSRSSYILTFHLHFQSKLRNTRSNC